MSMSHSSTGKIPRSSSRSSSSKFSLNPRINCLPPSTQSPLNLFNNIRSEIVPKHTRGKTATDKYKGGATIEDFLIRNNFEKYAECFKENGVRLEDLNSLTKEDLIDMKIPIGPRNRILKSVEEWVKESQREIYSVESRVERPEVMYRSRLSAVRSRPSSRNCFIEESYEDDRSVGESKVVGIVRKLAERQEFMMKAIEENQKAILLLSREKGGGRRKRCSCSENY